MSFLRGNETCDPKLAPCRCGGTAVHGTEYRGAFHYVLCEVCGIRTQSWDVSTPEQATEDWNKVMKE